MEFLIIAGMIYLIVYQRKLHQRIEEIHKSIRTAVFMLNDRMDNEQ